MPTRIKRYEDRIERYDPTTNLVYVGGFGSVPREGRRLLVSTSYGGGTVPGAADNLSASATVERRWIPGSGPCPTRGSAPGSAHTRSAGATAPRLRSTAVRATRGSLRPMRHAAPERRRRTTEGRW